MCHKNAFFSTVMYFFNITVLPAISLNIRVNCCGILFPWQVRDKNTLNYVLPVHLHSLNQFMLRDFVSSSLWTAIKFQLAIIQMVIKVTFAHIVCFPSFQEFVNQVKNSWNSAKEKYTFYHYISFTDKDKELQKNKRSYCHSDSYNLSLWCPTFPLLPFPPSWSSHCQSTPLTTRPPVKIPRAVIFFDFRRDSRRTLTTKDVERKICIKLVLNLWRRKQQHINLQLCFVKNKGKNKRQ